MRYCAGASRRSAAFSVHHAAVFAGLHAAPLGVAGADLEQRRVARLGCFACGARPASRARPRWRRRAQAPLQGAADALASARPSLGGGTSSVGGGVETVVVGASLPVATIPACSCGDAILGTAICGTAYPAHRPGATAPRRCGSRGPGSACSVPGRARLLGDRGRSLPAVGAGFPRRRPSRRHP